MNQASKTVSSKFPEVYIVHCVDAEGPLNETLCATFERLKYIFGIELEPNEMNFQKLVDGKIKSGNESIDRQVAVTFSKEVLSYNRTWAEIEKMNSKLFSEEFRTSIIDSFQQSWKITWFCLDHINYLSNPREKALGYSVVYNYYKNLLGTYPNYGDELQWHFHPKSITLNPIAAATSYQNSISEILEILTRKIVDDTWFPTAFRPGFHSERQDSNLFLEQWFPFDFGNQRFDAEDLLPDMQNGRFGNWVRAPKTWRGYHPSVKNYDIEGELRRKIFRCLNLGTRLRLLGEQHIEEAFLEAISKGDSVIAFTDHDFRDIAPDIEVFNKMLDVVKSKYPDVRVRFCSAEEAAQRITGELGYQIELDTHLEGNQLIVKCIKGQVFGSQPFLAIKSYDNSYFHDNFDFSHSESEWSYVFDDQTIQLSEVTTIGVAAAGKFGGTSVKILNI